MQNLERVALLGMRRVALHLVGKQLCSRYYSGGAISECGCHLEGDGECGECWSTLSRTGSCAEVVGKTSLPGRQDASPVSKLQQWLDGWIVDYLNDGWLLPLETDRLLHERTTVRFLEDGGREVHCDDWRTSSRFEGQTWRGYTFIRVSQPDLGTLQAGRFDATTDGDKHAEDDDDSYERIDS